MQLGNILMLPSNCGTVLKVEILSACMLDLASPDPLTRCRAIPFDCWAPATDSSFDRGAVGTVTVKPTLGYVSLAVLTVELGSL